MALSPTNASSGRTRGIAALGLALALLLGPVGIPAAAEPDDAGTTTTAAEEGPAVVDLGPASLSAAIATGLLGKDKAWVVSRGLTPPNVGILDRASETVETVQLPQGDGAWASTLVGDTPYFGTWWNAVLYRLEADNTATRLWAPSGMRNFFDLATTPDGIVVAGGFPDGRLYTFDPATQAVTDYGVVSPGQEYVRSVAADEDTLYAGTGASARVGALDRATGVMTQILPTELQDDSFVYDLAVTDDYVIAGLNPSGRIAIIDKAAPGSYRVVHPAPELSGGVDALAVDVTGSTVFATLRPTGELFGVDLATGEVTAHGAPAYGQETRNLYVEGTDVVGFPAVGGMWTLDLTTGEVELLDLQAAGLTPGPEAATTLAAGPGRVLVGGNFGAQLHDLVAGTSTRLPLPGEPKAALIEGDTAFLAQYPAGTLDSVDLNSGHATRHTTFGASQIRPRDMVHRDGAFLIGTQPEYGQLGGALVVVDDQSYETDVYRHVVRNQSIASVEVLDGTAFLGSETEGGIGSTPTEREAVLAFFDLATGAVTKSLVPVPGARRIEDLAVVDGALLGVSSTGVLFEVDAQTGAVVRTKQLSSRGGQFSQADGVLMFTDGSNALRIDPETWETVAAASGLGGLNQGSLITGTGFYYTFKGDNLVQVRVPALPEPPPPVAGDFDNVALAATGATATASGSEVSWLGPDKAIDGIVNRGSTGQEQSRWSSNASDSAWLTVAFAEPSVLNHVVIEWQERCAARYKLQVSVDGVNWVDATPEIRATCDTRDLQRLTALTPAQQEQEWSHLRMQAIERSTTPTGGKAALSLWEIQAWSPGRPRPDHVVAAWDFTTGQADDVSGNGHDGVAGAGVTFNADGARFTGADDSEIAVPYSPEFQPEAIRDGERWRLELDDVVPSVVGGDHRAVMSGRVADDGWIVYVAPNGEILLFIAQETGAAAYVAVRSGVFAKAGLSYDVAVEWDGTTAKLAVTGAGTGSATGVPAGGYDAAAEGPTRFGNGGNSGTEFLYAGTIGGASISVGDPSAEPPQEPQEPVGEVLADWDFTAGNARDTSGNGHDGVVGTGVTFSAAGAQFNGTNAGEIAVPYSAEYQPEAIDPGEKWRLELDDVVPSVVGGTHRAIFGNRANNDGVIVYLMPDRRISLYVAQNSGSAGYVQVASGVVTAVGGSYDIVVEWDGAKATLSVTGSGTGSGSGAPSGGYKSSNGAGPARYGNGGNAGSEFFFAGSIGGATISIQPLPQDPPATTVCRPSSSGVAVRPIDWDALKVGEPTDEASVLLRDIVLNASRYSLGTWMPAKYGNQDWRSHIDFGGNFELQVRGPAMAAVGVAVPLATGAYDADTVGLSEEEATERVVRLATSLAYRHRANTTGGWGDVSTHWQTPLWAYYAGMAAWLVWDDLTPADQACVQNMVEFEADRVPAPEYYRDGNGTIISGGNTQAEEDSAWASLLGLATAMLPEHDSWADWQQRNVELLIAAYSRPVDVGSEQVLNGRRLSEVLEGSNIENDGTVINHGFLHPIYMLAFDQSVNVALTSSLAGQATPEAAFHNVDVVYNALADMEFETPPARTPGGTIYRPDSPEIYYPYGNDWGTKFPLYFGQADVIADVFGLDTLVDPGAAYWEKLHNAEALAMQQRHADGRTYANNLESNYALKEERITQMAGLTYLTRWLAAQDAVSVTDAAYASSEPVVHAAATFSARLDVPDNRIVPGGTTEATITMRNDGDVALEGVAADLQVPDGWAVTSDDEAAVALAPGAAVEVGFQVQVPMDAQESWAVALTGSASHGTGQGRVVVEFDAPLTPASFAEPPVTVAAVDETAGATGWYTSAPTVTLSATDNVAVASTKYRLGDGAWTAYTGPVSPGEGDHALAFRSTDTSAFAEVVQELRLRVDLTAPEVDADVDDAERTVTLAAADATSGVASVEYSRDGGLSWVTYSGAIQIGKEAATVHYRATDVAGLTSQPASVTLERGVGDGRPSWAPGPPPWNEAVPTSTPS